MSSFTIGVLALQGAFAKHIETLRSLGVKAIEVRKPDQLEECDALIIPGGESTAMFKQMLFIEFMDAFKAFSRKKPVFGTCAGMILMSNEIIADKSISPFQLLDISVERNAFGRQVESFRSDIEVCLPPGNVKRLFPAIFIRAPRIRTASSNVKILGTFDGEPVLVQQGYHLGATFHPELSGSNAVHAYFLSLIKK